MPGPSSALRELQAAEQSLSQASLDRQGQFQRCYEY